MTEWLRKSRILQIIITLWCVIEDSSNFANCLKRPLFRKLILIFIILIYYEKLFCWILRLSTDWYWWLEGCLKITIRWFGQRPIKTRISHAKEVIALIVVHSSRG